jgi:hypothetical protein
MRVGFFVYAAALLFCEKLSECVMKQILASLYDGLWYVDIPGKPIQMIQSCGWIAGMPDLLPIRFTKAFLRFWPLIIFQRSAF